MDNTELHQLIDEEVLATLGDLDFRVYHAMLSNAQALPHMRVADVAELASVSTATVIRFCKKCGYAGFPELKDSFTTKLNSARQQQPLPPLLDDIRAALENDARRTFEQDINEAFKHVRRAQSIFFLGNCRSGGLAVYGASLFNSLGCVSYPVVTFPASIGPASPRQSVAIIISHGGSTPAMLPTVHELVAKHYDTICITANPSGPIALLSGSTIVYRGSDPRYAEDQLNATRLPVLYAIERLGRMFYNERHLATS